MASFKIHDDQENQLSNLGGLKNNLVKLQTNKNSKLQQKRTILGDINSNSSRIITRAAAKGVKVAEKSLKAKSEFVIHEDVLDEKLFNDVILPNLNKEVKVQKEKKEGHEKAKKEEKLQMSDTVVIMHRLPSLCELKNEEEPLLDTNTSPDLMSPMSIESVKISSPVVRHTKPSLHYLYDMEEYRKEIFSYLLQAETRQRAKPLYMRRQPEVTYSMRSILVDWLVEVAEEYKLHTETLYLAVSFIDRFLSVMSVVKGKLQLLGTAAMFLAAKYEEIYPPDVGEFVYITDDTYNKRQMLRMEQLILKVLAFDISIPTTLSFLQHIAVDCNLSLRLTNLAQYLCELTLLEGDPYLNFVPSVVASSALAVARHCLEYDVVWSSELQETTGYNLSELAPCIGFLNVTHNKAVTHPQQAICEKYKSQKFQNVAQVKPKPLRVN